MTITLIAPGRGLVVGLLLLLVVETWFHSDAFLYRFRSVFAAGRAMDKLLYVESHPPDLLIIGNSRADNGFDPITVLDEFGHSLPRGAFNLGLPGADARIISGLLRRLDSRHLLGRPGGINFVVISLDEALVQDVDTLGQEVFYANRREMWEEGQLIDIFRSVLRMYGYADNFRQLREPSTISRFLSAMGGSLDPWGGSASLRGGYRPGLGKWQNQEQALRQEAGSSAPPKPANLRYLARCLNLLAERGVHVAVVFPPLLNRDVLYLQAGRSEAEPFLAVVNDIKSRGLPIIHLDDGPPRSPDEFANAGHLNDRGAQRYSRLLGRALADVWTELED